MFTVTSARNRHLLYGESNDFLFSIFYVASQELLVLFVALSYINGSVRRKFRPSTNLSMNKSHHRAMKFQLQCCDVIGWKVSGRPKFPSLLHCQPCVRTKDGNFDLPLIFQPITSLHCSWNFIAMLCDWFIERLVDGRNFRRTLACMCDGATERN